MNIIWVRFGQDDNNVNKPADAEEASGKKVKDAGSDFAFVEAVCAEATQEQTEEKCNPFVNAFPGVYIDVNSGTLGRFVLSRLRAIYNRSGKLLATEWTLGYIFIELLSAVLAIFKFFCRNSRNICGGV